MRCTIDNRMLPAIRALVTPTAKQGGMLRICAEGECVVVSSSSGKAEVPSKVLARGVVFIPARSFVRATRGTRTRFYIVIEATAHRVCINEQELSVQPEDFKLFEDPGAAPETWVYEKPRGTWQPLIRPESTTEPPAAT